MARTTAEAALTTGNTVLMEAELRLARLCRLKLHSAGHGRRNAPTGLTGGTPPAPHIAQRRGSRAVRQDRDRTRAQAAAPAGGPGEHGEDPPLDALRCAPEGDTLPEGAGLAVCRLRQAAGAAPEGQTRSFGSRPGGRAGGGRFSPWGAAAQAGAHPAPGGERSGRPGPVQPARQPRRP